MSLLSADSLLLYLTPTKVQAVHMRGWTQTFAGLHELKVTENSPDGWLGALEAALRLTSTLGVRRVRVLVSDQLVRYFCFPWAEQLRNTQEELSFARLQFDDTYGSGSNLDWTLSLSDEAPPRSRLACAIPLGLLEGLRSGLAQDRVKLLSVRPHLVCAINSMTSLLPRNGWIMSHEPGRLTIAGWDDGGWKWVSSNRVFDETPATLLSRLRQELVLAGNVQDADGLPTQVAVFSPRFVGHAWNPAEGIYFIPWSVESRKLKALISKASGPDSARGALSAYSHALAGAAS